MFAIHVQDFSTRVLVHFHGTFFNACVAPTTGVVLWDVRELRLFRFSAWEWMTPVCSCYFKAIERRWLSCFVPEVLCVCTCTSMSYINNAFQILHAIE